MNWSPGCINPNWNTFSKKFADCLPICLSRNFNSTLQDLFFPDGRDSILDVSSTSKFPYAHELSNLLPRECEKQFLMFDEVVHAFERLALSYVQRTSALQRYCNSQFRALLVKEFRIEHHNLPPWLATTIAAGRNQFEESSDPVAKLTQNEEETPGPADDVLLRTRSTTAQSFTPAPLNDTLSWDDQTHQLVRFILHRLFHPSDAARLQLNNRVCIFGMSAAFLNGAEGYFEGRVPNEPGRIEVRLVFPASVVHKVQTEKNTNVIKIPEERVVRYPDDHDVVSIGRLERAFVAGCTRSGAWLQKFTPFLTLMSLSLKRRYDDDITMAEFISRFKHLSCSLCLDSSLEPVDAYLRRKIAHARQRLRPNIHHAVKVRDSYKGREFYTLMSVGPIKKFVLLKLIDYCRNGSGYSGKVDLLNADGSKVTNTIITFPSFDVFHPKAEFDQQLALAAASDFDSSASDTRADYDREAYNDDTDEILSCLAASFPNFKMHGLAPHCAAAKHYNVINSSNGKVLQFTEVDLGMSFKPFFSEDVMPACDASTRARLMKSAALEELNRCFFIHLGSALDVHPFALQTIFRKHAQIMLTRTQTALSHKENEDDAQFDELWQYEAGIRSVLRSSALVDASVLPIVWPQELDDVRVLILAVGADGRAPPTYGPLPSASPCFCPRRLSELSEEWTGTDVILKLEGAHFTLLRPRQQFATLPIDAILGGLLLAPQRHLFCAALKHAAGLFDMDSERCPLHLQSNVSGMIAQEAGRPKSVAQLFCEHCPTPLPPATAASTPPAPLLPPAPEQPPAPLLPPAQEQLPAPLLPPTQEQPPPQEQPPAPLLPPAQYQAPSASAPCDSAACAAELLCSLSLIDPAAEAIPYD